MQATLLQAVKEASIIAGEGKVVIPHLWQEANGTSTDQLPIPKEYFTVVQEGMRKSAQEGTAKLLNLPYIKIGAKTGTAELGSTKARVNSWVIGFFPYDHPRYAFAIVMDRGVRGNTTNASFTASLLFKWMAQYAPQYLGRDTPVIFADTSTTSTDVISTASTTIATTTHP